MTATSAADHPHGHICAYCGQPVLTGNEKPEHPLPAAIGSSLVIFTVCDRCNEWANKEIDQPWLGDDWTMIFRATHDIRDQRRAQSRRPLDPMRHGFTDEGVRVSVDENWKPTLGSKIIEDGDKVRIVAGSEKEAERLLEKVRKRAEAEGKRLEMGNWEKGESRPTVCVNLKVNIIAWRRMAAKIALGVGSAIYPEDWRLSGDAEQLRTWMRDPEAPDPGGDEGRFGILPERIEDRDGIALLVDPPEHLLLVAGSEKRTSLLMILFGELLMSMPLNTNGDRPPDVAWLLDPSTPRRDGRTSLDELTIRYIKRLQAGGAADD